jgi:transposase-like protein
MDKLESQISKEVTWRDRLTRHAASGKSIAAFCRDEAISAASFHVWRTKLENDGNEQAARPAPHSAFIDIGAVKSAVGSRATEHSTPPAPLAMAGIDIRIDLGGGVVLTIARR